MCPTEWVAMTPLKVVNRMNDVGGIGVIDHSIYSPQHSDGHVICYDQFLPLMFETDGLSVNARRDAIRTVVPAQLAPVAFPSTRHRPGRLMCHDPRHVRRHLQSEVRGGVPLEYASRPAVRCDPGSPRGLYRRTCTPARLERDGRASPTPDDASGPEPHP